MSGAERTRKRRSKGDTSGSCWYCSVGFQANGQLGRTEEHLVAKALGGPVNDPRNIVYAHSVCNQLAGDFNREEKELLRLVLTATGTPCWPENRRSALSKVLKSVRLDTASPKALRLLSCQRYRRT